ncbi:GNAT family N-acetyltransferase [Roseobacter sp. S98]|uniref:GNAT family N-acetyltransferase n=1 Tax=Roseobacter algicola (ex Choi et al. 2025) (nom. illeg.) TaxID=3092138 RepID=UPI0035C72BD7
MTKISFSRLSTIPVEEIAAHMSDPILAVHMPLLDGSWDTQRAADFVAMKEARWAQDGLGHWAILSDGDYVGWGGFQREGADWDFGLVLKPSAFGLGNRITAQALAFARGDARIPSVTFLLPPTRKKLGALKRLGAQSEGDVTIDGALFRKYRLATDAP